jgi:hypothetical protein
MGGGGGASGTGAGGYSARATRQNSINEVNNIRLVMIFIPVSQAVFRFYPAWLMFISIDSSVIISRIAFTIASHLSTTLSCTGNIFCVAAGKTAESLLRMRPGYTAA